MMRQRGREPAVAAADPSWLAQAVAVINDTSPLAPVIGRLRSDGRLAGMTIVQPHPLLLLIRRRQLYVVLTPAVAWERGRQLFRPFAKLISAASGALILLGRPGRKSLDEALSRGLCATVSEHPGADELYVAIHNAFELLFARRRSESRGKWLNRYRSEMGEIIEIARAISKEREIDKLMALILERSRAITDADAGSIYVVEGDDPEMGRRTLHFKLSQNDSVVFDSSEFSIPISPRSVAGYVALHKSSLNIGDVYDLPLDAPYGIDKSFDEAIGYRTKSMLCTPLLSRVGDVIGVIQLINRKVEAEVRLMEPQDFEEHVIPFDERSEELLATLASQAGIALENAILYDENQRMLEGFVTAAVEAIEQRDPTTSGHSRRVADLTVALAKAVERTETGPYREVVWTEDDLRELEYASLLHDFGKIGVREQVLVKAKKLYPHELALIEARFDMALRSAEVDILKRQLYALKRGAGEDQLRDLEKQLERRRSELQRSLAAIVEANEPQVVGGGDFATIETVARQTYITTEGLERPLLDRHEVTSLRIPRGSLTPDEFDQIRNHVSLTVEFLSRIPWGRKFRRVVQIAGAHHERLDGTGYPSRARASEIPVQSKIMSVSDIFDALTAADRPYKRAVPLEPALDILRMEVRQNHLDGELVRIFIDAKIFELLPAIIGNGRSGQG